MISLTAHNFHGTFKKMCFLRGLAAITWVSPDRYGVCWHTRGGQGTSKNPVYGVPLEAAFCFGALGFKGLPSCVSRV